MGQKTNPIGFRLGVIKSWESRWFSEKDYSKLLQEDITIRKFLIKKLSSAGISKVVIERPAKLAKIKPNKYPLVGPVKYIIPPPFAKTGIPSIPSIK